MLQLTAVARKAANQLDQVGTAQTEGDDDDDDDEEEEYF